MGMVSSRMTPPPKHGAGHEDLLDLLPHQNQYNNTRYVVFSPFICHAFVCLEHASELVYPNLPVCVLKIHVDPLGRTQELWMTEEQKQITASLLRDASTTTLIVNNECLVATVKDLSAQDINKYNVLDQVLF